MLLPSFPALSSFVSSAEAGRYSTGSGGEQRQRRVPVVSECRELETNGTHMAMRNEDSVSRTAYNSTDSMGADSEALPYRYAPTTQQLQQVQTRTRTRTTTRRQLRPQSADVRRQRGPRRYVFETQSAGNTRPGDLPKSTLCAARISVAQSHGVLCPRQTNNYIALPVQITPHHMYDR